MQDHLGCQLGAHNEPIADTYNVAYLSARHVLIVSHLPSQTFYTLLDITYLIGQWNPSKLSQ